MLKKRIWRQLKNNFAAYSALFLLIALGMFYVVSTIASADTIISGVKDYAGKTNVEDGEFTVFTAIDDSVIQTLTDKGISLEQQNYTDYDVDNSTIRIFKNREQINFLECVNGRVAKDRNEIALEQHYAKENGLNIGDTISVGDVEFKICGLVCTPDYETCLKDLTDPSVDSKTFGTGFLTEEGYENLAEKGMTTVAETVQYAYVLHNKMTDSQLKNELEDNQVTVLSMYIADQNGRIGEAEEDVAMNEVSGIVGGFIIFLLIGYVISIFQAHKIGRESTVIGTMYALGLTKREMLLHYLAPVFAVTFLGGIVGTCIGFQKYALAIQMDSVVNYYSIPKLDTVYPLYLIVYGIVVPSIMVILVNYIVLNKKLGQQPLVLLRHQKTNMKHTRHIFSGMKFKKSFMLRQLIREYKCRVAMVFGVFLSMLLIMMAMNIHVCISNLTEQNKKDCTFEYMYYLKAMPENIPDGAHVAYVKKYSCDAADGSNIVISILGIDEDNPFFKNIHPTGKQLVLSSSTAIKMDMSGGETIQLDDIVEEEHEKFKVSGVAQYSYGTFAFMDLDEMRNYFQVDDGYYNVLFSDKKLDIDANLVYSVTTKADIEKFAAVLSDNMAALTYESAGVALLIFIVVVFLMMKFIMDRSEFSISLMRTFGYTHGELYRLYMASDIWIFLVVLLVSVFSGKAIMDAIWPNFVAHVSVGLDLSYTLKNYGFVIIFALIIYAVISLFLSLHLKRMERHAVEVLKERE